jgi:hypothetical protein
MSKFDPALLRPRVLPTLSKLALSLPTFTSRKRSLASRTSA